MKFKVEIQGNVGSVKASTSCPHCNKRVTLDQVGQDIQVTNSIVCGQRMCSDPNCKGHLFVVMQNHEIIRTYPPIRIDFEHKNIPKNISKTLEEALDCHANECYIASAIMIRRTLEEICANKDAQGDNLHQRLKDLKSKIILPKELLDALDELKLLGNDAAHIEAKTFSNISEPELSVAIELTKEILKSLYQYEDLLNKIRGLKKSKNLSEQSAKE